MRATRYKPLVDEKNYTVIAPNGYRRGSMLRAEAIVLAKSMQQQMHTAGWRGETQVIYRDGSVVWRGSQQ